MLNRALTIAGSDCSGGAGIQADLKTFAAHNVYGMSVITSITAQNTTGVTGVHDIPPDMVTQQMQAVFTDIFPDAVKIGMVSSTGIVQAIVSGLKKYKPANIVLDPVMVATSGASLLQPDCLNMLVSELIPLADIITPNLHEAELLAHRKIRTKAEMIQAAEQIATSFGGHILIKGGHLDDCSDDLLYYNGTSQWYQGEKIQNPNTHGTGCTLSSSIAANLACGADIPEAVRCAKEYVTGALNQGLDLGRGNGPLFHGWQTWEILKQ